MGCRDQVLPVMSKGGGNESMEASLVLGTYWRDPFLPFRLTTNKSRHSSDFKRLLPNRVETTHAQCHNQQLGMPL